MTCSAASSNLVFDSCGVCCVMFVSPYQLDGIIPTRRYDVKGKNDPPRLDEHRHRQVRAQAIGSMLVRVHAGVVALPVRIRGKSSKARNEINQIARSSGIDIWLLSLDTFRTFATQLAH